MLSAEERATFGRYPEVRFLTQALQSMPTGAWDRVVLDALSPGRAVVILNDVFSPSIEVPSALVRIYDVFENREGVMISFNYDGIDQRQTKFRVIAPHGRRPDLLLDPMFSRSVRESLRTFYVDIPTDWHLPIPESERVIKRPAYQAMVAAWARARSVVFVGYGFGGGADSMSFRDFGLSLNPAARVHVLCPGPENAELCRQIGYVLRGRPRGFRVIGQPFRWRPFAEAVLGVLDGCGADCVRAAVGKELEIAVAHDRG